MNTLNLADYGIEQNKVETAKIQKVFDEAKERGTYCSNSQGNLYGRNLKYLECFGLSGKGSHAHRALADTHGTDDNQQNPQPQTFQNRL